MYFLSCCQPLVPIILSIFLTLYNSRFVLKEQYFCDYFVPDVHHSLNSISWVTFLKLLSSNRCKVISNHKHVPIHPPSIPLSFFIIILQKSRKNKTCCRKLFPLPVTCESVCDNWNSLLHSCTPCFLSLPARPL